jgi:hypothetical protein
MKEESEMAEAGKAVEKGVKGLVDREGKYLTFALGKEEYGVGILKVKEIIGMMPITSVPRTGGFMKGGNARSFWKECGGGGQDREAGR